GASDAQQPLVLPVVEPWVASEKLQREFDAVGFYLSAHPLDEYRAVLSKMRVQTWSDFAQAVRGGATAGRLAGAVTARRERRTRHYSSTRQCGDALSILQGVMQVVLVRSPRWRCGFWRPLRSARDRRFPPLPRWARERMHFSSTPGCWRRATAAPTPWWTTG